MQMKLTCCIKGHFLLWIAIYFLVLSCTINSYICTVYRVFSMMFSFKLQDIILRVVLSKIFCINMSDYKSLCAYEHFNVRTLTVTEKVTVQMFYLTIQIRRNLFVKPQRKNFHCALICCTKSPIIPQNKDNNFVPQWSMYIKRKLVTDNTTKERHQFSVMLPS
jgi:hypothetical protein